ncbi:hypothetical protein C8J56DRAFT_892478 [Mycena floridula]|nr:hypothetical protein C8J56DRAFT_892478 [Mycena floridula]
MTGRIWDSPGVLKLNWATFVEQKQQEIEVRTVDINQWADKEFGDTIVQPDPVEDILGAAAVNPNITLETSEMIIKFYSEFANKSRNMRHKVSSLKEEIQEGLDLKTLATSPDPALGIKIIALEERDVNSKTGIPGHGPTATNQVCTENALKGALTIGNRESLLAGSSKELLSDRNLPEIAIRKILMSLRVREAQEEEVKNHWKELAKFKATIRAQKLSLENAEKEKKERQTLAKTSTASMSQRHDSVPTSQVELIKEADGPTESKELSQSSYSGNSATQASRKPEDTDTSIKKSTNVSNNIGTPSKNESRTLCA